MSSGPVLGPPIIPPFYSEFQLILPIFIIIVTCISLIMNIILISAAIRAKVFKKQFDILIYMSMNMADIIFSITANIYCVVVLSTNFPSELEELTEW